MCGRGQREMESENEGEGGLEGHSDSAVRARANYANVIVAEVGG